MRYVIEGMWRGCSQDYVSHREVYKSNRKGGGPFLSTLRTMHAIPFSDGTALIISVREAKPREKVSEKIGYRKFIRDAVYAEQDRQAKGSQEAGHV